MQVPVPKDAAIRMREDVACNAYFAGLEVMERMLDELHNQAQKTIEKGNRRGDSCSSIFL